MKMAPLLFFTCCASCLAQLPESPDPRHLLEAMRAGLPHEALHIDADIQSLDRRGEIKNSFRAEADLHFDETPARTSYRIYDAFGDPLASLEVLWRPEQPVITKFTSDGSKTIPDLSDAVLGTDMSWNDLLLSYLWIDTATYLGEGRAKNRLCHILEYTPSDSTPSTRLWLDQKLHMLLRAETRNTDHELIRQMNVRSFKKVDDRWVLQDLEVKNLPRHTRTLLRVRTVSPLAGD